MSPSFTRMQVDRFRACGHRFCGARLDSRARRCVHARASIQGLHSDTDGAKEAGITVWQLVRGDEFLAGLVVTGGTFPGSTPRSGQRPDLRKSGPCSRMSFGGWITSMTIRPGGGRLQPHPASRAPSGTGRAAGG